MVVKWLEIKRFYDALSFEQQKAINLMSIAQFNILNTYNRSDPKELLNECKRLDLVKDYENNLFEKMNEEKILEYIANLKSHE